MTDRRRRLWSLIPPRYELLRGVLVLALLTLHAWRDGVVLAFCAVAIPLVRGMGG